MSDRGLSQILAILRRRSTPKSDLVSDGELLGRYIVTRDEAAFELLVRRHGGLVIGVANRVLQDVHAAEDVFQATFLTLARKAKSLRRHESLAGWLYRVALRIAVRANTSSFRLRRVETTLPEPIVESESSVAVEWRELRSVLDEEIEQLPERFRSLIVLCYLSGKSTEEAAQLVGCPRGTVLSRLAAGRQRLRDRLTRRGYVVSTAVIAAGLASETAPAGLSVGLVALAMKVIGPTAMVAPAVASLSYGVLNAMFMTKMKIAAALMLMAGGLGIGVSQLGAVGDDIKKPAPKLDLANRLQNDDAKRAEVDKDNQRQRDEKLDRLRADEDRRRNEVAQLEIEKRLLDLLRATSKQRIESKSRILDLEDRIDEVRQSMAPTTKMLDQYLGHQVEHSIKLNDARRSRAPNEAEIKTQLEGADYLGTVIEGLRHKLQKQRAEIRGLRRLLLEAEEELALKEQVANMEVNRIQRGIR